ncbi:hypothetical protein [Nonomuraea sp. LPB2021202275-12-8]|uniref:hypothetical protein n=1 Tax=Nonomuraea sp. LPB2021202275-12-8 TaxID=3120159 RepID=UPI00300D318B
MPAQPSPPGINKFVEASPDALPIARVLGEGREPSLEDCERQIAHVTNQWLIGTSEALTYIHANELWRKAKGVIYDSWKGYLRHRLDMTPQRAHQLMKARRSALAVAPVAKCEIKEGHTRVLERIYEAVGKTDMLPDEAAAEAACKTVWQTAAKQTGRPSAAALERVAVREGYLESASEPEPPALPPAPSPAWQRIAPALQVVQDLAPWKDLVKDAPAKGFEAAYYLMKAANEIGTDLGEEGRKLLQQAVLDGKLPEKLDL